MKVRFIKPYSINEEKTILQGSELEVITGYCGTDGYYYQCIMPDGAQIPIHDKYVEIIDYAPYKDWEQIRANAAIAAMQGIIISGAIYTVAGKIAFTDVESITEDAKMFADNLIKKLKDETARN